MKKFVHGTLTAAVLAGLSANALADTYQLVDLDKPDEVRNTTAVAINNNGNAVLMGRFPSAADIDLSLITSRTRAISGIPQDSDDTVIDELTDAQYTQLIPNLEDTVNGELRDQRISTYFALFYDGSFAVNQFFNDTDDATPEQEDSVDSFFYGLNESDVAVGRGSAPYEPYEHTYLEQGIAEDEAEEVTDTYFKRDFISRGVWYWQGDIAVIEPPEQAELGGESALYDINDNNLAVGYASVGISPAASGDIDECAEAAEDETTVQPYDACVWTLWASRRNAQATNVGGNTLANNSIYDVHAFTWQLDANGEVISEVEYGTLLDRDEDDQGDFSSYAYAVNNNDIAVGQSWTYFDGIGSTSNRIKMPAIFRNGEVEAVTEDERYIWGSANDINDNNVIVGYVKREVSDRIRNVGFAMDLNAETPELVELDGFFTGSGTTVNAINNNGLVVGTAEIEANISTTRRRVGFLYDLNDDGAEFIDLNDTVSCDSGYFIVSAEDINDQGEILATAVIDEEVTEDGETITRQSTRAVRLNPTGDGELNSCGAAEEKTTREGASINLISLFGMLLIGGLITLRRKFSR